MCSGVYATGNDLPEKGALQVIDLPIQRQAEAIDLDMQAKHAHWNVKGPECIALHKLFDEVCAAVADDVDLLAERIVQLGGVAAGTVRIVAERSELSEYPHTIADGSAHGNALAEFGGHIGRAMEAHVQVRVASGAKR